MDGGKTSLQINFLNQNGRTIFECFEKVRPYLEKKRTRLETPISAKAQVGIKNISDEGRYGKTANAFEISRAFISVIRRVSYAVTTFVGPKLIRLPTIKGEFRSTRFPTVHV